MPQALDRVRAVARRDRNAKFTALLHHVDVARLRGAYHRLNPEASPGVDGVTWHEYGEDLERNLVDLHARVHRGAYRAKPSRRQWIPKPDGRERPLGIAALEDKIVQMAVLEILEVIWEVDFLGFSYGFRRRRGAHDALDALAYVITRKKVNWVLDADIRGFFDAIDHERLLEFVERRVGDPRILRLIRKWLKAGVLEDGDWAETEAGTPQGATISPLLANIYLHYVLDQWIDRWRKTQARGEVYIVRYADDFVIAIQHRKEAEQLLADLRGRLAENGLELHPDKTRCIEFGRFAAQDRARRGQGKPETFDFLGFTHICARSKRGKFLLRRHTIGKRFRAKLHALRPELWKKLMTQPREVGPWLHRVLAGYYRYYAVPTNLATLRAFRQALCRLVVRLRRRRGDRDRTTWARLGPWLARWLPPPRPLHPWPEHRMTARLSAARAV